jgi:hypothetical protein
VDRSAGWHDAGSYGGHDHRGRAGLFGVLVLAVVVAVFASVAMVWLGLTSGHGPRSVASRSVAQVTPVESTPVDAFASAMLGYVDLPAQAGPVLTGSALESACAGFEVCSCPQPTSTAPGTAIAQLVRSDSQPAAEVSAYALAHMPASLRGAPVMQPALNGANTIWRGENLYSLDLSSSVLGAGISSAYLFVDALDGPGGGSMVIACALVTPTGGGSAG